MLLCEYQCMGMGHVNKVTHHIVLVLIYSLLGIDILEQHNIMLFHLKTFCSTYTLHLHLAFIIFMIFSCYCSA